MKISDQWTIFAHRFGDALQALSASREKSIPTASYGTLFNTSGTLSTDAHSYFDLRYEHTFSKDWSLLARVFYDRYLQVRLGISSKLLSLAMRVLT